MPGGAVPSSPLGLTPHLALARPPVALDAATVPAAAGVLAIVLVAMATLGGLGGAAPVAAPVSALAVAVAKPTRHRRCTSLVRPVAPGTMAPLGLVFGRRRPVKAWCRRPRRRQRYLLTRRCTRRLAFLQCALATILMIADRRGRSRAVSVSVSVTRPLLALDSMAAAVPLATRSGHWLGGLHHVRCAQLAERVCVRRRHLVSDAAWAGFHAAADLASRGVLMDGVVLRRASALNI
jgi:hypothetical protein